MTPSATDEEDRRAIIAALDEQLDGFLAKDFDRWSSALLHEPRFRYWLWQRSGGLTLREGWETQARLMREAMTQYPGPNRSVVRRENVSISIRGDMALVTFDQHGTRTGDAFDLTGLQKEMRVMERHDGRWLVAFHCALQREAGDAQALLLGVDAKGKVQWTSEAAAARLKQARLIAIAGGRIKAEDRDADRHLRDAIAWAASLDDGLAVPGSPWPFAVQSGARPVVLEVSESGAAQICWVIATGGQIVVALSDEERTIARLETAASVYGISPTQLRLVHAILNGQPIVEAAARLKISVATARTHLQRMYDKTGVHTQPALVRVLMSLAAPL
jgi:DNA-binding CsgD family transcriptional regulator